MKSTIESEIRDVLDRHKEKIYEEWITRLNSHISPRYSARKRSDFTTTVSMALNANCLALLENDFSAMDEAIKYIGQVRGKEGFVLSEVQKAFELFRTILLPILEGELKKKSFFKAVERLNCCVAYTIHKFSDYFQELHEGEIRSYAQDLEATVDMRTRELAESERKYRQLVEEIRDGYFVNRNGIIVFANKSFCDMHGYTMEEVIGKHYSLFVAPESLAQIKAINKRRNENLDSEQQYIYFRLNKDGSSLPTENVVIRTHYQGGIAGIGICRDITERMAIEKRVREAERLAHIGQLTTSLAHEIRNPLSSAGMSIQALLKSLSVSGNDKRRLEILAKEVSRVDRIITEMLDFAKPIKFYCSPVSISSLIDSCLDIVDAKIRAKLIKIRKKFPRDIPTLLVDCEKMEQALINLLLNAVEAVGYGGKIEISATTLDRAIRIEIRDNGNGIEPEDLPYVFDPFFSKKTKGTGLGLANAKKVIESHAGTISMRSLAPKGTCVTMDIPRTKQIME